MRSYAYGLNHFEADPDLKVVLSRWWPGWREKEGELRLFGGLAGREVYEVADHVDHRSPPFLLMHDLDGNRVDRVELSPAHARLLKELAPVMWPPYRGSNWHHHYALGYLVADPGLYCLLTITQQTVYALHKYAPELKDWKEKLLSGEFWGATWFTEVQGGSDLGANLTVARREEGIWRLHGEKYFASGAGLADAALVTARPEGAPPGPKGLALFLVPRLDSQGRLNFTVRRLKDKMATRAVPTGEVDLSGSEAFLVGSAQEGIYYALEDLTVSRLANAVGSMAVAKKAHLEALARVGRRAAFGRAIGEHPLMRRDLTEMAVRQAGGLALAFRAVEAFQQAWHLRPPYGPEYHYARFLSHLAKNRTAEHAAAVTQLAMEVFGGLGFLEEYAVARWHREALVTPIWEGTSNIQALDMLEVMEKKGAHEPFLEEVAALLERAGTPEAATARVLVEKAVSGIRGAGPAEAAWYAKDALRRLADAASVGFLYDLASAGGERYEKLAALYARRFTLGEEFPSWVLSEEDVWAAGSPDPAGGDCPGGSG